MIAFFVRQGLIFNAVYLYGFNSGVLQLQFNDFISHCYGPSLLLKLITEALVEGEILYIHRTFSIFIF